MLAATSGPPAWTWIVFIGLVSALLVFMAYAMNASNKRRAAARGRRSAGLSGKGSSGKGLSPEQLEFQMEMERMLQEKLLQKQLEAQLRQAGAVAGDPIEDADGAVPIGDDAPEDAEGQVG
ncbi:MAG TPA: hypothetical protein VGS21_08260 [Acidimicrobiales bacterium]|nr:hypothetical protein [Acidimicrobiales bacterium]